MMTTPARRVEILYWTAISGLPGAGLLRLVFVSEPFSDSGVIVGLITFLVNSIAFVAIVGLLFRPALYVATKQRKAMTGQVWMVLVSILGAHVVAVSGMGETNTVVVWLAHPIAAAMVLGATLMLRTS